MTAESESLLTRVVASIAKASETSAQRSILSQAAASYARKPSGAESTIPTGFDPRAASLFEAVVEAAFLVASADGVFDDTERQTFEQVVHESCQNTVQRGDVAELVSDLCDQLEEDGFDQRIQMIGMIVKDDEHKLEVLRIAALMAHVSGGVDESERGVLQRIAGAFGLGDDAVTSVLEQAGSALG